MQMEEFDKAADAVLAENEAQQESRGDDNSGVIDVEITSKETKKD